MKQEAGCSKNMHVHFDKNEEEEKATMGEINENYENNEEDEKMDENDDEPPFMDEDEGKCWEFACKIQDEQHLKEWCRNMGGFVLGREKKLTCQFDCQIKDCQFKAIFLKVNSNVYTRNKHNHHEVENIGNIPKTKRIPRSIEMPQNVGDDYVDYMGKIWKFQEEIGKNIPDGLFLTKYGLTTTLSNQGTLNLRCSKATRGRKERKCNFAGIFVKQNGCLYTRGEHEH